MLDLKADKELDIAVFRVEETCIGNFCGKSFLEESFIEQNPLEHLKQHNPVFLHATPSENYEIDYEKKQIDLTTFPYLTFAKGYNNDSFEVDINNKGINEYREEADVPAVFGMSGSFAYCHYPDSPVPYKCFGILHSGEKNAGSLWVLDMRLVLQFIDRKFI